MATANLLQTSVSGGTQNALSLQGDGVFFPKASTTSRLALTLGTTDKGFIVYDTTDNNIYFWNGTAWESVPSSGDAGANGSVQYNDNGIVSGASNFTYDKVTSAVAITGAATVGTTLGVTGASTLTGSVGIGAASSAKLSVFDTNGIALRFGDLAAAPASQTACFVGTSTGAFTGNGNGDLILVARTSDTRDVVIYTGLGTAADRLRVTAAGNVNITTGNVVMGTANKGIDFSINSDASATSELLNDYEEGTWTPTFTAAIGTGFTVTLTSATYTKIGRRVFLEVDFTITVAGSASSALYFTLPFSQASSPSSCGAFRESNSTGYIGQLFHVDGTRTGASFYNDSTVWVNNYRLRGSYSYNA